jgi:L-seryl-tRNA(Ser) seleniumtransferase
MSTDAPELPSTEAAVRAWIEIRALAELDAGSRPSLHPAVNATGVLLHTNLGRAPLASEALDAVRRVACGYSTLEFDRETGRRGHRHIHADRLLCELTGAERALVVNNTAAAAVLALAALASGREVVVSRGELVEIGGGFRVPEILAISGGRLREVGTTNRTRTADYGAAIGERTGALLRVHPSNFRVIGFAERPALDELVALSRRFDLPLIEDLGSGWLAPPELGSLLPEEPAVPASVAAGADLVLFSGDKLLGGPQAGIVVGRAALIERLRAHPLMRAVRADKLTYAALEATLLLWQTASSRPRLPIVQMLSLSAEAIGRRARVIAEALTGVSGLRVTIRAGESTIGGGSAPGVTLPTMLLAIRSDRTHATSLAAGLRQADPPVVARIEEDEVLLDLRTVTESSDASLPAAIRQAATA